MRGALVLYPNKSTKELEFDLFKNLQANIGEHHFGLELQAEQRALERQVEYLKEMV